MKEYHIKSLLPEWIQVQGQLESFGVESFFQFQLKWEQNLSEMWQSLTDSEREEITPIEPPYTEESVARFLDILKKTKENRSLLDSFASLLPDFTSDKVFPTRILKEMSIFDSLQNETHPVFLSRMHRIDVGSFFMGDLDKRWYSRWLNRSPSVRGKYTSRKVKLTRPFALGMYQVTKVLWNCVMKNNLSTEQRDKVPASNVSWLDCVYFCNALSVKDGLEPVYTLPADFHVGMTFDDQHPFLGFSERASACTSQVTANFDANGYRLPTEAEWEYAAKGGIIDDYDQQQRNLLYSGGDNCDDVGWYGKKKKRGKMSGWPAGNSNGHVHLVGQKKPNEFGLYDMSGNVWEWCWDANGDDDINATHINPTGPAQGENRISRGGSYESWERSCRVCSRIPYAPNRRSPYIGFRLARTIPREE